MSTTTIEYDPEKTKFKFKKDEGDLITNDKNIISVYGNTRSGKTFLSQWITGVDPKSGSKEIAVSRIDNKNYLIDYPGYDTFVIEGDWIYSSSHTRDNIKKVKNDYHLKWRKLITNISNIIIYVVTDIKNEDLNYINFFKRNLKENQELIIIHNLVMENRMEARMKLFFPEAKANLFTEIQKEANYQDKNNKTYYLEKFKQHSDKFISIFHYVVFKNEQNPNVKNPWNDTTIKMWKNKIDVYAGVALECSLHEKVEKVQEKSQVDKKYQYMVRKKGNDLYIDLEVNDEKIDKKNVEISKKIVDTFNKLRVVNGEKLMASISLPLDKAILNTLKPTSEDIDKGVLSIKFSCLDLDLQKNEEFKDDEDNC